MKAFLTPDDLADRTSITPGWYPLEIFKYEESPAKTDGSTNGCFFYRITPEGGAFKGRELRDYFNEKALGMKRNLWAVLFSLDKTKGGEVSTESCNASVGRKLMGYIKKDDNGKYDVVADYKPFVG